MEHLHVEFTSHLIIVGLISEDSNFAVCKSFESALSVDESVDQIDDFFTLAVHAESNSSSLLVIDEFAKTFHELFEVWPWVGVGVVACCSIIYLEVSLPV